MEEDKLSQHKEKTKKWIEDPYNLALMGILLVALVIRVYYFTLTKNQPLWWDELSFGSIAKTFFSDNFPSAMLTAEKIIRPPLFSLLWFLLIKMGASEPLSRFFLEFLPSVFSVFFIYLIGRNFSDKKTALVATFIISISWLHLFYSMRLLTSIPALLFSLMSIYYFLKSSDEINKKYFSLSILFLSLSVLIRYSFGLVGVAYLLFLIFTQKFKFLTKKSFWIGGIVGVLPIILFFLSNMLLEGAIFPASASYASSAAKKEAYAFFTLGFIKHILQNPFYIIFILGTLITIAYLFLTFDLIKKNIKLKFDFLIILILILNLSFLIFIIKYSEDRYLLESMISLVFLTSNGIVFIYEVLKKYSKMLGFLVLTIILFWGAYSQITFGNELITLKSKSFLEMKEAFLWLKERAAENTLVLGEDIDLYTVYYAEMVPQTWPPDQKDLDNYNLTADYIVVNAFHGNSDHIQNYLSKIQSNLTPVTAFFFDKNEEQPAVLIFKYLK